MVELEHNENMKKHWKSKCVANKRGMCSASFPMVENIQVNFFPDFIQVRLADKKMTDKNGTFLRCTYCKTVWWESLPGPVNIEIGTEKLNSKGEMSWFI